MKKALQTAAITFAFLFTTWTEAKTLGVSLYRSSSTSSNTFNFDWDKGNYDGSVSLGSSRSQSTDSTNTEYTSTTNNLSFDSQWKTDSKYYFGFDLGYSQQKENNITSFEPALKVSKKIYYGKKKKIDESDTEEFTPSYRPSFAFGSNSISTSVATKKKAVKLSLVQNWYKLGISVNPWENWSYKLNFKKYTYNKDVNSFLSQLDSPIFSALGYSQLSSGFGTFYDSSLSLGVTYTINDNYDISYDYTESVDVTSSTKYTDHEIFLDWMINDAWSTSFGISQGKSSGSNEVTNSFVLSLSYNF